ncbi:MAG: hypothetical protein MSG64_19095 [Pyrinomonadaceae bacterium MAG19_C2-C3]|nr:hypothetical protein [Pyrinomonadaceae bacterium MAG19_C2-C3]
MQRSRLEHFIEQNWAACAALAYHNYVTHGRGALVVKFPAYLDCVVQIGLKETHDIHISYAPLVHFQSSLTDASTTIYGQVADYIPEKQIVVVFLDKEGNFRLIVGEQNPTPVECFVAGADSTSDFTPVPEGALALPMKDADGGNRL